MDYAQTWPPYRLPDHAPIVQAMLASARATCGFGVLHAPNERIKLDTIQMTSNVDSAAIGSLTAIALNA